MKHFKFIFSYVLYGAVSYTAGHYVAFVRRSNNKWEMHNDLLTKISVIQYVDTLKLCPHNLIYIQTGHC